MGLKDRFKNKGSVEVKATVAYTVCSIIQKCLGFITLPLFTRLLTLEQYGQFSIYFSWSSIITIFTTMNLPYGSFSKAMVKFEDSRNQYISTVQFICIILTAVLLAVYLPLREYFNQLFELPTFLVIIMFFEILCNLAILCWTGKMRFEYKYKGVIALTLVTAVIAPVSGLIAVLISQEKGYARIIGYALITAAVGLFFLVYNFVKGKSPFRKDMWKYAFGMNLPLIAYYVSQVIFNQSDRIMISHLIGMDKAAVYSVAYNLAIILSFVIDAINNSYVPWFYGKLKAGKEKENKKVTISIAIFIAFLLLAIIALAPELIYVLAGAEYVEAKWVVAPIAMSLLLLYYSQLFINLEFYYEKKYLLIVAAILAAAVNIGLNLWLIPIFGYFAAGYTTLLSYALFALCNYFVVVIMLKKRKQKNTMYSIWGLLLVLLAFLGIGALAVFLYNYSIVRYIIIGVVLMALLIGMKWLIRFAKKFMKKEVPMQLRKLEERDAEYMLEWMHDKELCEHMHADFASKSLEDCVEFIGSSASDPGFVHFAIVNDADEYMGTVSLKNISYEDGIAEFGIVVRREAMGKGYSAYGMHEILDYAFTKLNLKSVVWCVSERNERANKFYRKHGYQTTQKVPEHIENLYSGVSNLIWYEVTNEVD